jgi:hypothetical protein
MSTKDTTIINKTMTIAIRYDEFIIFIIYFNDLWLTLYNLGYT